MLLFSRYSNNGRHGVEGVNNRKGNRFLAQPYFTIVVIIGHQLLVLHYYRNITNLITNDLKIEK